MVLLSTLGTRGFSRVRREFSVLAEGRHIFGRRPRPRAAKPREKLFARVTIKTWQKPETALEKSLAPRVPFEWIPNTTRVASFERITSFLSSPSLFFSFSTSFFLWRLLHEALFTFLAVVYFLRENLSFSINQSTYKPRALQEPMLAKKERFDWSNYFPRM